MKIKIQYLTANSNKKQANNRIKIRMLERENLHLKAMVKQLNLENSIFEDASQLADDPVDVSAECNLNIGDDGDGDDGDDGVGDRHLNVGGETQMDQI